MKVIFEIETDIKDCRKFSLVEKEKELVEILGGLIIGNAHYSCAYSIKITNVLRIK